MSQIARRLCQVKTSRAVAGLAVLVMLFPVSARDATVAGGAAEYWRLEDTGVVILNDNAGTIRSVVGIETFDMDGDGVMDSILLGPEFAAAPGAPLVFNRQSVHILRGGAVTTSGANLFPQGTPSYIASGWVVRHDLNGDGKPDLLFPDFGADAPPYSGTQNVIWLSNGNTWMAATMQSKRAIVCKTIRFENGRQVEAWQGRVSGFVPPAAPGRKPGSKA